MFLGSLVAWLSPPASAPDSSRVLDVDAFRRLLGRERMRADRSESKFALAVFEPALESDVESLRPLMAAAESRIRDTDEIGWLETGKVALLLPDTDADGAWKLVEHIREKLGETPQPPHCEVYLYPSHMPPDDGHELGRMITESRDGRPVEPVEALFCQPLPWWKRGLDILGAMVGITLLAPIMALTAVAVWMTSPGPILFLQKRNGIGGRPFTVLKFRTMHIDAEARKAELLAQSEQDGPAFKMEHDPRITPIGGFLRRTCLDELPQLFNVLMGDMTLVGPRPMDVKEQQHTSYWQRRRLDVTPGLTCYWQLDGGRKVTFGEWMRMDIRYIDDATFPLDVVLIFRTAIKVLFFRASV